MTRSCGGSLCIRWRAARWEGDDYRVLTLGNLTVSNSTGVSRENLEAVIDACRNAERLLPPSPENPAVSDLLLAVEGTHYTAAMLQRILYGTDCFDASQMHSWFGRYQAGWLRENKPSELWRLRQFLHDAEHKCRVAHRG